MPNFVYTETFVGFPIKDVQSYCGKRENHYNIPWRAYIYTYDGLLFIQMQALTFRNRQDWSIEAEFCLKFVKNDEETIVSEKRVIYTESERDLEISRHWVHPNVQYYLEDSQKSLTLKFEVKITKMHLIKEKLRNFDESSAFWDCALKINNQMFYVNKMHLASNSTYLHECFQKNPVASEMEFSDFTSHDFQNFLELINGESAVDEDTVDGLLKLGNVLGSKLAIKTCQTFLIDKSTKPLKSKLGLALKFELGELKNFCIAQIKNRDDIQSVIEKVAVFEPESIWKELLLKLLKF
ncbi:unnamed protein product [Caenorhabditis nigoni]